MFDPLIDSRAVHFASSLVVGGVAIFSACVAYPTLTGLRAKSCSNEAPRAAYDCCACFCCALGSDLAPFPGISHRTVLSYRVMSDGTAWSVLTETQFGRVWECRLLVAILLSLSGFRARLAGRRLAPLSLQAGLAILSVGMLAWSGHAAGDIGFPGLLHLRAMCCTSLLPRLGLAACPLLMFVGSADREFPTIPHRMFPGAQTVFHSCSLERYGACRERSTQHLVHDQRTAEFSRHRIWRPGPLKIALFLAMLGFGAANRYWLTPRLRPPTSPWKRIPEHSGCSALLFRLKSFWGWS